MIETVTISFSGTRSRATNAVKIFAVLAGGRGACLFFSHKIFPVCISISTAAFAATSHSAPMAGSERKHRMETVSDGRSKEQRLANPRCSSLGFNAASALKKVDLIGHCL